MTIFPFEIKATEGKARTGTLKTPRGEIRTPAFMPPCLHAPHHVRTARPVR